MNPRGAVRLLDNAMNSPETYELENVRCDSLYIDGVLVTSSAAELNAMDGVTASAAELNIMDGVTATAAEINAAADGSANTVVVAAAGGAVTALTGGGTYLVPLVTSNVTFTLPAATLGEKHTFRFIGSAADAEDWVITSPTLFVGGPAFFDVGGTNAAVYANGSSHTILTVNNPAAGTELTFIGDGTNWAVTGLASSADAPAFT
jgi:hypothetical protein